MSRRFQFSLRMLLALTILMAFGCAIWFLWLKLTYSIRLLVFGGAACLFLLQVPWFIKSLPTFRLAYRGLLEELEEQRRREGEGRKD